MRLTLLCLPFVTPAAGAEALRDSARLPSITLYADFQQPVSETLVNALRTEVDARLAPAGLQLDWQNLPDFRSDTVSTALAVAHFEGRCEASGLVMRGNTPGELGWTEVSGDTILPFSHIDCERIRTFLQTTLLGFRPEDRETAFGRALGRVLVHELLHIFGTTLKHTSQGATKERYTVEDLIGRDLRISPQQVESLRRSKMFAALRASSRPL